LLGYLEGQVDCSLQHPDNSVELAKLAWRAEQVSFLVFLFQYNVLTLISASPLNGEAAELWDKDPEEFKKKVLGRHRIVDDE
jgi:ubiquitin-protein ligase